jgi:hypothetical protein
MRWLGRLCLLLALIPLAGPALPEPVEDRSIPGYCSPDCPLQQTAHAVAIPIAPTPDAAGEPADRGAVPVARTTPVSRNLLAPDAPRGPPFR